MKEALNTVVTVNYNTADFVELILFSAASLCAHPTRFVIVDNGSCTSDLARLMRAAASHDNVTVLPRQQKDTPSLSHGKALDYAFQYVQTPYVTVMDSDAVFLCNHWDVMLMNAMTDRVRAVGTPPTAHPQGRKPRDFPLMFACMYDAHAIRELGCSFLPVEGAEALGKDTGWEIREAFLARGYEGAVFELRSTRCYKEGHFAPVICDEYYNGSVLVVSHFGRGATFGSCKYFGRWQTFLPMASKVYRRLRGLTEKRRWIGLARAYMERQAAENALLRRG